MDEKKKIEQKFKVAEREAFKYCGGKKVEVTKDSRELDALKKEYEEQQKQFSNSVDGQSYEDIHSRKCMKELLVQKLGSFINVQDKNLHQITEMVKKRKKFFVSMRSMSMRCISRDFSNHMNMHNLEGTLTPNYKTQSLGVDVRPKRSKEQDIKNSSRDSGIHDIDTVSQARNFSLASLSGGERSKTLVCLINALWNVQEPPFRCLDEWDVFLDAVARKNIEAMLVKTALHTQRQYFFISPQGSMFADIPIIEWDGFSDDYKDGIKVFTVNK